MHKLLRKKFLVFLSVWSYPQQDPFDAKTTNMDTYLGTYTPIPDSYKPEEKPVKSEGAQDFNTVHR